MGAISVPEGIHGPLQLLLFAPPHSGLGGEEVQLLPRLLLRALGSCLLPHTMPPRLLRRENTAPQDTLKIMVGNIGRQVTIGTVTDTAIRKSTTKINFCRISAFIRRFGRNIGSDLLCLF